MTDPEPRETEPSVEALPLPLSPPRQNPYFQTPPELINLIFKGGSVKGIAYVGALAALEQLNLLYRAQNVAGTSAGAITALLVAIGCTTQELLAELVQLNIEEFLDDKGNKLTKERLKKVKEQSGVGKASAAGSAYWDFRGRFGLYKTDRIAEWLGGLIEKKTGRRSFTFGELAAKVAEGQGGQGEPQFRNLCVHAFNVNTKQSVQFDHKSHPRVFLLDAVLASLSIPLLYEPQKVEAANTIPGQETNYDLHDKIFGNDKFVDGGIVNNYPISSFDTPAAAAALNQCPPPPSTRNGSTLGFYLANADEINYILDRCPLPPVSPEGVVDYIGVILETLLSHYALKEHVANGEQTRTLYIDTGDIGMLDFHLTREQKNTLIQAGWSAVWNSPLRSEDSALPEQCPLQLEPEPEVQSSSETESGSRRCYIA